jgi:D-alanine transaminase
MPRIAYVNGLYQRTADSFVSVEDRGFLFADAIYEVWSVFDGRLADSQGHMLRLERSLKELRIDMPMSRAALEVVLNEVIRRNGIREGMVYLQISRGAAPRDHVFPSTDVPATVVVTAKPVDRTAAEARAQTGICVISTPDIRWGRCDIKTVGLLPAVLAKQAAKERGAGEVLFVDADGFVTEGGSTNVWIIDANGTLVTRDLKANILSGVTRLSLVSLAREMGYTVEERAFTVAQAQAAQEVFVTAATSLILPVIRIDNVPVGNGKPGQTTLELRKAYIERARLSAGS